MPAEIALIVVRRKWIVVLVLLVLLGCRNTVPAGVPPAWDSRLPTDSTNSSWWQYNDSDTVFVFVHGIFSNSKDCWLYRDATDRSKDQYWPELVATDKNLQKPAVYVAGYYADVDSGEQGISTAAQRIEQALTSPDAEGRPAPLAKRNVIFVAHSLGGNVVRYLLESSTHRFADKTVGLMLLASPAAGSNYADRLSLFADLYKNELGKELRVTSPLLADLDRRFRNLIDQDRLPFFVGAEAVEHHFIFHRRWLPGFPRVVSSQSGGQNFGAATLLEDTDHFTIAKPKDLHAPSHGWLVQFMTDKFAKLVARRGPVIGDAGGSTWQLADAEPCPEGTAPPAGSAIPRLSAKCAQWLVKAPRTLRRAALTVHATANNVKLFSIATDPVNLRGAALQIVDEVTNGKPYTTLSSAWCDARDSASVRLRIWLTTPLPLAQSLTAALSERDAYQSDCDIH